jgi:hypothetical protein
MSHDASIPAEINESCSSGQVERVVPLEKDSVRYPGGFKDGVRYAIP